MDKKEAERYRSELTEQIKAGQLFERLARDGWVGTLEEYIFDPMQQEAFDGFKTMDPSDTNEVNQIQKTAQVIDNIKTRIESIIENGNTANIERQQLDNSTQEGEDE